jgi:hypothetical protein
MRISIRVFAGAALGAAIFVPAAQAQDTTTYTFNGTTLYIGGGFQYLSLPDIKFTGRGNAGQNGIGNFQREKNSQFGEYGGGAGAGIETALGYWGGSRVTVGVKGFWTALDHDTRRRCHAPTCIVIDPTGNAFDFGPPTLVNHTDREVDYWGGSVEMKFGHGQPTNVKPNVYRNDYFIIGADVRGIDQDIKMHGVFEGRSIYGLKETIDTTYVGGYVGFGGEYSFGFIPFVGQAVKGVGGIYDRLGLRTFLNVRAGLYNADTDYDGRFAFGLLPFDSRLTKSSDELAFIGTVSLETRKQIGQRTSLSLWTDYEYISSVPKLRYADYGGTTRIDDDWAWGSRTMLRLNIGLGSAQLYEEPLK